MPGRLEERYDPVTEELESRLDYELTTIKNMGYVDYFLIVWDLSTMPDPRISSWGLGGGLLPGAL